MLVILYINSFHPSLSASVSLFDNYLMHQAITIQHHSGE